MLYICQYCITMVIYMSQKGRAGFSAVSVVFLVLHCFAWSLPFADVSTLESSRSHRDMAWVLGPS